MTSTILSYPHDISIKPLKKSLITENHQIIQIAKIAFPKFCVVFHRVHRKLFFFSLVQQYFFNSLLMCFIGLVKLFRSECRLRSFAREQICRLVYYWPR